MKDKILGQLYFSLFKAKRIFYPIKITKRKLSRKIWVCEDYSNREVCTNSKALLFKKGIVK